jgi:hypothetical protein
MPRFTPLGAVARGLASGLAGTAAMTAYQSAGALRGGAGVKDAVIGAPAERWEDAPAPAQVGYRFLSGMLHRRPSPDRSAVVGTVVHWLYGAGWGAVYGVVRGSLAAPAGPAGVVFGTAVWGSSYVALPVMGIYDPPWKYPAKSLAQDWSYHAVYGLAAGLTFAVLDRG